MLYTRAIILLCCVSLFQCSQLTPRVLSKFKVTYPGFVILAKNTSVADKQTWNIIISRFNGFPFSTDYVSLVRDIGNPDSQDASHVEQISSSLHWPNEPESIPGKEHYLYCVLRKSVLDLGQVYDYSGMLPNLVNQNASIKTGRK